MVLELRDSLYGDIILPEDEVQLLDTFEMQRLRRVKQLGNTSLVYPSANHTRFEHSLGTRWLLQKIIRLSNLKLDHAEEKILYKSAILHDVAEPCFCHVSERLVRIGLLKHEEVISYVLNGTYKQKVAPTVPYASKIRFVSDVLRDDEKDQILEILNPVQGNSSKVEPPMTELVNGLIDADCLDYLRRDSQFLGLPYGNFDDRIFASFRIINDNGGSHIAFRNSGDSINAILSVLEGRYNLRAAAYYHHTTLIADEMFLLALKMALKDGSINELDVYILGDNELLQKMRNSESAREIVERLLSRRLFKRAYVLDHRCRSSSTAKVDLLLTRLNLQADFKDALKSQIDSEDILLFFPLPESWKDYGHIKLASDDGTVSTLETVRSAELNLLKQKYDSLWKFMVVTAREDIGSRNSIYEYCEKYFGEKSAYLPRKTVADSKPIIEQIYQVIGRLQKEEPSSYAVLQLLLSKQKNLTREELSKELNLMPSTVSHYLNILRDNLRVNGEDLIIFERRRRSKYWGLRNEIKEAVA